ncbi:MAG: DMT family transporter [Planctomycetales bacterium]|nr:DMT family transporter [Planctomycetales bacterium]
MRNSNITTASNATTLPTTSESSVMPDISLVGVAAIWGINIPLMKIGLEQVEPFFFNGVRLTISTAVLASFALLERRRGLRPNADLKRSSVFVYGLLIGALYQVLFLCGVERTTSGNTALIIATVPMWTALLARVFLRETLSWLSWCGLFLSLTGTIIVAFEKGDVTLESSKLRGNAIVLAAALVWAIGTVYSRPLLKKISPMQLSAASSAIGLPVHLVLAAQCLPKDFSVLASASLWMIIVYSGSLSSGLSQPMWNFGVRHAGAAHAAIVQNLIPVVAIVVAWLARGEIATPNQFVGGALILGGLATMRIGRRIV